MKRGFLIGMFLVAALGLPGLATRAQEITLFGGATRDGKIHDNSYAWAIDYLQGIDAHSAFSVAWVNGVTSPTTTATATLSSTGGGSPSSRAG